MIWLSPALASHCSQVNTNDLFVDHLTLSASFELPLATSTYLSWPLPSRLPWTDTTTLPSHDSHYTPFATGNNSTHFFRSFSQQFDHSRCRLHHQHAGYYSTACLSRTGPAHFSYGQDGPPTLLPSSQAGRSCSLLRLARPFGAPVVQATPAAPVLLSCHSCRSTAHGCTALPCLALGSRPQGPWLLSYLLELVGTPGLHFSHWPTPLQPAPGSSC